jgi:hypothetical protein
MPKLNKRETIIVVLMACAVLFAVYEIFFAGSAGKKAAIVQMGINNESSTMATALISDPLAAINTYIITRAEADWQKNPFMERNSYKEWTSREGAAISNAAAVKIIYSGYIDAGKKKMAIINGSEYSPGEKLEMEGYILKEIRPSKVIIRNKNTGSDLEIFLQE